jgi:hypothetical protein
LLGKRADDPLVMRFLRLSAALVVLGVVSVLAGCGGGGGTTVSGEPISLEQLSRAATSSAEAESGRFAFSLEMSMPGTDKPFAFTGEGAFDAGPNRAQLSFDFSSFAELLGGLFSGFAGPGAQAPDFGDPSAWRIEAVQDDEVVYMRFPAMSSELPEGKSWVRVAAGETAEMHGFDFSQLEDFTKNDPREALGFLRAASERIETVGTEELRGATTTHYRATVNLAEYEKLVPASEREELGSMTNDLLEQSGLDELPVDLWLDEDGFVRQLVMSFSAKQPGTTEPVDGSMKFELWDYGKAVDIDLPPASQVVDAASLD